MYQREIIDNAEIIAYHLVVRINQHSRHFDYMIWLCKIIFFELVN